VIDLLRPRPGGLYVDATAGLGGHAEQILRCGGRVLGVEWDDEAAARAAERLELARRRLGEGAAAAEVVRDSYANLGSILESRNLAVVDGILLDLGVSSLQFDTASRGFSFQREGPLDMRMSPRIRRTAADLLRDVGEGELERILREYGEEPRARKIAAAIVRTRGKRGRDILGSTRALAEFVGGLVGRHGRIHPATRVFQALRIAVNDELENLKKFLEVFDKYLGDGGRCCVIAFHSLEDRLVKWSFRQKEREGRGLRVVTRKPVRPSREEVLRNPRARSAKLRCLERSPGSGERS
jgi:16S rRNA (cytosine1402-N4)-methyltransferase